ncbi:MAG: shikimate kinase [Candidatus Cloacimonetes bacterium]|nr:shikimate kinase [Candidatus Cloacimonadota bacterium]
MGRVVIIGFMACGKSWWSKKLSESLQIPMYEIDDIIIETENRTIREIFTEEGEAYFRNQEEKALQSLPLDCIVSTGGGVVEREPNRNWLKKPENFTIWLSVPFQQCYSQLVVGDNRPQLTRKKLEEMWRFRQPLYRECADTELQLITLDKLISTIKRRKHV